MIDRDLAESALVAVRDLVAADGGDVELAGVDGGTVELRLLLADAACAECVMPRSFLETVALDLMRGSVPGLEAVLIDDPREPSD
ncbi:MAG: NifU family protein [Acidimicrobiales bacterium]